MKLQAFARGEASSYEETSSTVDRTIAAKHTRGGRKLDRHEKAFVLTSSQYKKFEQCMSQPTKPTAKMVIVAAEMLEFSKKSQ